MSAAERIQEPGTEGVEPSGGAAQYLTFMLAGEEYAVDILRVRGIRGWQEATKIPNTPPYVLGVVNIRGAIVPVIDLRRRFGLDAVDCGRTTVVIVVRIEEGSQSREVGMVVDAVSDVCNIEAENLKPPPDFGMPGEAAFARGLATLEDKMIIVLNIDTLLGVRDVADGSQSGSETTGEG